MTRQAPSLVDLCVRRAVANVRHLRNVGEIDDCLLGRILPHCTQEQLTRIENCTARDLSPVTDKLWKNYYRREFGDRSFDLVAERLGSKINVKCSWRRLFEAKAKEVEEKEARMGEAIKERYKTVAADKQKRQIQVCMKVPPSSSSKRSCVSKSSSSIMKKAKMEFIREGKNISAQRNLGRKPAGAASSRSNVTRKS